MKARVWSTICAATVLATTLFAASAYAEDVRGAIEATNATFAKHVAAKDSAALAGLYTEDAAVIAPGAPVARGTAAIEADLQFESLEGQGLCAVRLGEFLQQEAVGDHDELFALVFDHVTDELDDVVAVKGFAASKIKAFNAQR